MNGRHVVGPYYAGQVARSVYIPHPSGTTVVVEIHDLPGDTEPVDPVAVVPNTRPDILWNAVPGAVRYRIYHCAPARKPTANLVMSCGLMKPNKQAITSRGTLTLILTIT